MVCKIEEAIKEVLKAEALIKELEEEQLTCRDNLNRSTREIMITSTLREVIDKAGEILADFSDQAQEY